jgi:tetratricopeptide (TPR) repeat protein
MRGSRARRAHGGIEGVELLDKVIDIDQSPIGRTPRSNPATYTGCSTISASSSPNCPSPKVRGYKPGASASTSRAAAARSAGRRPDQDRDALPARRLRALRGLQGPRYNRETLEVYFKGKNIADVLDMTRRRGLRVLRQRAQNRAPGASTLNDVGLGYVKLGPAGTTLSGGEAQRVKLAAELRKVHRTHALHPRRADHRPALSPTSPSCSTCSAAASTGQHGAGDRAQPRRHQVGRLGHRPGPEGGEDAANRGNILLGQALYALKQFGRAEQTLLAIDPQTLAPDLGWQRNYWLCRVQLDSDRPEDALQLCTNGLAALAAGRWRDVADTISLQGAVLEKLGRLPEAIDAYTNNLAAGLPADIQRHSLLKAVDLMLKLNQTQEAGRRLEAFIQSEPGDSGLDVARLTLGELQLKASFSPPDSTNPAPSTNLLRQAMTNFTRILLDFHDSPLRGKACLDRGWCMRGLGELAGAESDFAQAIPLLGDLPDRVVARFKLADTEYDRREYSSAITNYDFVIQESEKIPALGAIFKQSLYQLLRAGVANNDSATSEAAVSRIVEGYKTNLSDECTLLYGVFQSGKNRSEQARRSFSDMIAKFPNSRVRPDAEYEIARTYAQEGDWPSSVKYYDRWVAAYPKHPLLPRAEFSRGLAHFKAGDQTNAMALFTNFVARFPTNDLAPWAQNWVADNYFNRGDQFDIAEKAYVDAAGLTARVSPSAEIVDLGYRARLMAGRAAFARQGTKDLSEARDHFVALVSAMIKDTNAPVLLAQTYTNLLAQTYFALGDTILQQFSDSTNASISEANEAITAFSWITNNAPASALAPAASGRIGDCYFQWAAGRPGADSFYTNAAQSYRSVLDYPQASVTIRSCAEVRLGRACEKLGQIKEALIHYSNVIYGMDPENYDPVWIKEAGVNATGLYESQNQWADAIAIYNRVLEAIPSLRLVLDKKITTAAARRDAAKK